MLTGTWQVTNEGDGLGLTDNTCSPTHLKGTDMNQIHIVVVMLECGVCAARASHFSFFKKIYNLDFKNSEYWYAAYF